MVRLLLLAVIGCHEEAPPAAPGATPPPTLPVVVRAVAPAPVALEVDAWGTLLAERVVELRPEAEGQVVEVRFADGDAVRAGQELVRLRDGLPRAQLREATAQLTLAEADLARATELLAKERTSQAEVDALTARRDLARVAIDRANEAARRTRILAPFDGWIGVRDVDEGDVINPSTVVGVVYEVDPVRAAVSVPERLASQIQLGAAAVVRVDAWSDQTFPGTVSYVAPALDTATRTLGVHVSLRNADHRLRPGMTARATLTLGLPADTITVPAEAITTTADGARVWVVVDGIAHARAVVTGERRTADVIILSGLQPGEQVVVEGLVRLREGARVATAAEGGR